MAGEVITRQELIDAAVDAQTIEDFVNGPAVILTTRLGASRQSLALLLQQVVGSPAALVARRYYATRASAVADGTLATGQVFTSDEGGTLSFYVKTGTSPFYQFVSTVVAHGLQTQGQLVISTSTSIVRATHVGRNLLVNAAATLTFPNATGGFVNGESIAVSNISATATVTLAYTLGGDGPSVLYPGETALLISDGAGYWRAFFFGGRKLRATSVTQLKAATPYVGRECLLDNGVARGDFVCRAGTAPVSDTIGGVYVTSNTAGYYWERTASGTKTNLAWFAPAGDGTTDDRAALAAASAFGSFRIPAGRYRVASNLTIGANVEFDPGAVLVIPDGVSVTINGSVTAGTWQIFDWPAGSAKTGFVSFDRSRTWYGFAEWWGGAANLGQDSLAAITAALNALLTVQLQAGNYRVSSTLLITQSNRSLIGVGSKYETDNQQATRLLVGDGSQWAVRVGPATLPGGGINAFQKDNLLKDIYIGRTVAPVISSNCIGVRCQYLLSMRMDNVKTAESMTGFSFYGVVSSKVRNCESVRASVGTGAGTDYWRGYHMDGSAAIGAAGGNASLYLYDCAAGCNVASLQTGDSIGFYYTAGFTDNFNTEPETVNCRIGIGIYGNDATGNTFSNTDLHILHPILDQSHYCGIYVTDVAEAGSVEIIDPYCGPASDGRASIWVNSSVGAVRIHGGQLVHGGAPTVQPVLFTDSDHVDLIETIILEAGATYPAVGCGNVRNAVLKPRIKNKSVTGAAAVQLSGTMSRCIVEPVISGKANAFQYGIQVVGTADNYNEYRVSGIDTACLQSALTTRKLDRNGTAVTAIGATGTNYATGVFA